MTEAPKRTSEWSRVSMSEVMRAPQANLHGTAHGGALVYLADTVAGAASARHCGGPTYTGTIEEFVFLKPVPLGSVVTATGTVTSVGRTSVVVDLVLIAEPMREVVPEPPVVATGTFRMVHIDRDGRPVPAPPLAPSAVE